MSITKGTGLKERKSTRILREAPEKVVQKRRKRPNNEAILQSRETQNKNPAGNARRIH